MTIYDNPQFTVDNVLFTVEQNQLMVLMVKRTIPPFQGRWSLPGGFVDIHQDDSTDMTARRKLKQKTGVLPNYLEQLQVFSGLTRDPRGFSVTLAYYALVAYQHVQSHIATAEDARWINVNQLDELPVAFDHKEIIAAGRRRLEQKALYSLLPVYCLPEQFTITQLKEVIEAIIGTPIQRKSLMRRLDASGMFSEADQKVDSGGRKAQLYQRLPNADLYHFERNLGG